MRPIRSAASLAIASMCLATAVTAQDPADLSEIVVRGSAEIELDPDFAELTLGVEVQAPTADSAASRMNAILTDVADTLASLGLPADSFPRTSFGVSPRYDYDEASALVGYSAQVALTLHITDLEALAELIGGALAAGATRVGAVQFRSTMADTARIDALAQAYDAAQREAEALAAAAGGRLGRLLELTTDPQGREYYAAAYQLEAISVSPISVQPQQVVVRAQVRARWEFLQG